LKKQLQEKNNLIDEIYKAFGDIEFPIHCGLQGALAKDEWIDDDIEIAKITQEKDIKGKWWEIPYRELDNIHLAQCYLDAKGVLFYLPAFLLYLLNDKSKRKYHALLSWLNPPNQLDDEYELYPYFIEQFSLLNKSQKDVSIKVLKYIKRYIINPKDTITQQEIEEILKNKFWQN
jgi:dUTPase